MTNQNGISDKLLLLGPQKADITVIDVSKKCNMTVKININYCLRNYRLKSIIEVFKILNTFISKLSKCRYTIFACGPSIT